MSDNSIARAMVRGMVAGAAGTVAMTLTQRLEMSVSGRAPSTVPGQVGAHLIPGADPAVPGDVARLGGPVHWGHGVAMGALRGLLDVAGREGPAAGAAHFALVWGGDAALYRTLGIAEVPWRWSAGELGADLLHKGVYAAVTGAVYDALRQPVARGASSTSRSTRSSTKQSIPRTASASWKGSG